jgi:isochorismate synthase
VSDPVEATHRRTLGPAFDLLAAYEPTGAGGFFFERSRRGVAARGAFARLEIPAGDGQVARADRAVRDALASAHWEGDSLPVAVGALPFRGTSDAVMIIPTHAVRRGADGITHEVFVGEGGGGSVPFDRPTVGSTPHEAFADMQVRPVPPLGSYEDAVGSALDRLRTGALRKVVLARTVEVEAGRELDPRRLVQRLRAVDPDCYAFAAPTGSRCTLVGATPELLVSRHGSEVRANPLAGSAPRSGDAQEDRANAEALGSSAKDREEHAIVVESVFAALHPLCSELRYDAEPALLPTANVWHLSTRFRGRLREPMPSAMELASALHPTPAVCGTPTADALALITELEPFDRGCYAGPVGWVDASGDGEWAIALRCAELDGSTARLFAGAGIVHDSDPAAELDETERKFRALLDSLRWG